jgi:integrase
LRGHRCRNALTALRSLFQFAKRRRLVFTDPTRRLSVGEDIPRVALPMTDEEVRQVELTAGTPAQRFVVALAAVHAARAKTIRELTLADIDLANERITLAGHQQRLS